MTIEEIKQKDLQLAVKDINAVLGTKQNIVAGRQVLIDFIVGTIGGCIGPNPDNPDETVWTDQRAAGLKPETQDVFVVLSQDGGQGGVEGQSPEVATARAAGQPDPAQAKEKPCPDFGKNYDPNDPTCTAGAADGGPCKHSEECAALTEKAKEAAKTGGRKKREPAAPKKPKAEHYGYVHAAHDAILSGDMSRDDLAKKMVGLYTAKGGTGDVKQARRNLDSDLRSLLVFGVVREEGSLIILVNRQ